MMGLAPSRSPHNKYSFHVGASPNTSIPASTWKKIAITKGLNPPELDPLDMIDDTNDWIVIPKTGFWFVGGSVCIPNLPVGTRSVASVSANNDTNFLVQTYHWHDEVAFYPVHCSGVAKLTDGDTVRLVGLQNDAVAHNTTGERYRTQIYGWYMHP